MVVTKEFIKAGDWEEAQSRLGTALNFIDDVATFLYENDCKEVDVEELEEIYNLIDKKFYSFIADKVEGI